MKLREPIPVVEVLGLLGPLLSSGAASSLAPEARRSSVSALEPPESATPDSLTFVGPRTPLRVREGLRAALAFAETGVSGFPPALPVVPVCSIHAAMAVLLAACRDRFLRTAPFPAGSGNRIAPSAVVEGVLEGDVIVGAHAFVAAGAFIGRGSRIEPNASVLENCRIGRDCIVQSGTVIGCDGFGFFESPQGGPDGRRLLPMPHPSGVVIGDDCFIGANTVVAAGVLRPTEVGRGCKLDSHVQIAHNVVLGEGSLLASQSGIAGSTCIGARFRMGGAASVDGHLRIGVGVTVAACSGVTKDVPDGAVVAGFPARPVREWRREQARRFAATGAQGAAAVRPGNGGAVADNPTSRKPEPARLSGPGVHTGLPGRVVLTPREDGAGVRFFFPGHAPMSPEDLGRLPRRALRSTIVGAAESPIRTPEHLLAALLFFSHLPLDVVSEAAEIPGLDGSALAFRDALSTLSPRHAADPRWREYDAPLEWNYEWEGGFCQARPARHFCVTYEIDSASLRQSFRLESPAQAWREILPARTFAFLREWRQAGEGAGLMAGAARDSGLLLAGDEGEYQAWFDDHKEWVRGPYPLLNQDAWRMENEPVKHKILDLLGDLALLGLALPRLEIRVRNGGHFRNHVLLEKISQCRRLEGTDILPR